MAVAPRYALRFKSTHAPSMRDFGAGEGNRTLVVSLEGFCSTIELHPPGRHLVNATARPHPSIFRVDAAQKSRLPKELMSNLNARPASATAHYWWRGCTLAARWRD